MAPSLAGGFATAAAPARSLYVPASAILHAPADLANLNRRHLYRAADAPAAGEPK
jgi:hypothetical protein